MQDERWKQDEVCTVTKRNDLWNCLKTSNLFRSKQENKQRLRASSFSDRVNEADSPHLFHPQSTQASSGSRRDWFISLILTRRINPWQASKPQQLLLEFLPLYLPKQHTSFLFWLPLLLLGSCSSLTISLPSSSLDSGLELLEVWGGRPFWGRGKRWREVATL